MIDFLDELLAKGITEETVMPDSIRGFLSEDPLHQSKWKTYYQSANHPRWGVLLISEPDRLTQLEAEIENTRKLEFHCFHVPEMGDEVHSIVNHLNGPDQLLAVIVEHVDGAGPFKVTTSPRTTHDTGHDSVEHRARPAHTSGSRGPVLDLRKPAPGTDAHLHPCRSDRRAVPAIGTACN